MQDPRDKWKKEAGQYAEDRRMRRRQRQLRRRPALDGTRCSSTGDGAAATTAVTENPHWLAMTRGSSALSTVVKARASRRREGLAP